MSSGGALIRNRHLQSIGIAALYYFAIQISLLAVVSPENVSVLWLPSGYLVAVLLLTPRSQWFSVMLWVGAVHFAAELKDGRDLGLVFGYSLANLTEVLVAARLYLWATKNEKVNIDSVRDVISLPLMGVGSLLSATIAASTSILVDGSAGFLAVWVSWAISSFDSLVVLCPAIIVLRQKSGLVWTGRGVAEAGLLTVLLASAVAVVFGLGGGSSLFLYLPYPLIIWAALRFRLYGAVSASLFLAVVAIVFTVLGRGTMAELLGNPIRLLWLQAYLGGAMLSGLVVAAAIVERETAEAMFRTSQHLYQTLAESAPVGIFRTTVDGRYRFANASWCGMTKQAVEQLAGANWMLNVAEVDRERVASMWNEAGTARKAVGSRFSLATAEQRAKLVYGKISPEIDEAGDVTGYVGAVTDLSALEEAERARHLLAATTEQSDDAIAVVSKDWGIVYVNAAYEKHQERSSDGLVGEDVRLLADSAEVPWNELEEAMAAGRSWHGTIVLEGAYLHRHETISVAPIREETGETSHYILLRRDVTEEYRLASALSQAQKMEAIGVLAGGIAHDFNNLLTAILGRLELLDAKSGPDPSIESAMEAALEAASLTRNLLTLSRRGDTRPGPCNVNETVSKATRLLSRDPSIEIQLDLSDELKAVSADQGQLTQAILNLCINACDAMPEGGTLRIQTALGEATAAELAVHSNAPAGRYVEVRVSDTGTGMAAELVEKVFEPFFTTKQQGGGTGLGLAMVYAFSHSHRGWVDVTTAIGKGTEFRVVIPEIRHAGIAVEPEKTKRSVLTRVLLVDDTDIVLETMHQALEDEGYAVYSATGGQQALEIFDRLEGAFEVVVTDLAMPKGDGFALLQGVRTRGSQVPVILMSGLVDSAEEISGKFSAFLPKPFSPGRLSTEIETVLQAEQRVIAS